MKRIDYKGGLSVATATPIFETLSGSNQPATGNKNVQNAAPELRLTTTGDSNYSKIIRTAGNIFAINNYVPVINYAFTVNGSSQYATVASYTPFNFERTDSFSISVWVKPSATTSSRPIFDRQVNGSPYRGYCLRIQDGKVRFFIVDGTATIDRTGASTISTVNWSHIVLTYSGSSSISGIKIYVNGVESTPYSDSGTTISNTMKNTVIPRIGANLYGEYFSGSIDEPTIWNKELSQSEVTADYNAGNGTYHTTFTNILACWHFDEGVGVTYSDFSGNGNTAVGSGTPTFTPSTVAGGGLLTNATLVSNPTSNYYGNFYFPTVIQGLNLVLNLLNATYLSLSGTSNDYLALGSTRGNTFAGVASTLTVKGQLLIDATGSSDATPRTLDAGPWQSGDRFRIQTGSDGFFQAGYGQRGQFFCWHGIEIYGARGAVAPAFVAGGGTNDPNVSIINVNNTNVGLSIIGTVTPSTDLQRWYNTTTLRSVVNSIGKFGIYSVSPTAYLHLGSGTATASTAPLKLTTGVLLTNPESGAIEFVTDNLYFTITTGTARKNITLDEGLTSGRIPYATTNGRLTDSPNMTWDGTYGLKAQQPYGSMYGDDVTITTANSGVAVGVEVALGAGLTTGSVNGFSFSNSTLTALVAGKYQVHWSLSLSSTNNNEVVAGGVMINTTPQSQTEASAENINGGKPVCISGVGIVTLAISDVVKFYTENDTAAHNITVTHANMTLTRVDN